MYTKFPGGDTETLYLAYHNSSFMILCIFNDVFIKIIPQCMRNIRRECPKPDAYTIFFFVIIAVFLSNVSFYFGEKGVTV